MLRSKVELLKKKKERDSGTTELRRDNLLVQELKPIIQRFVNNLNHNNQKAFVFNTCENK